MANNVTLHQKNKDGAYDNLYPRTTANHTMLTSATGNKYGLTDGNAEQAVGISMQFIQAIGAISIYVKDSLSNPIEGAIIQGLNGNPSTNASGFVHGTLVTNPIIVKSPYVDLKDKSVDVSGYVGTTRVLNVTLDSVGENEIVRYISSTSVKFSSVTKTIDVCCVGAGGGGGNVQSTGIYNFRASGGGGGGGGIVNSYTITVESNILYPIVIGEGGGVEQTGGSTTAFSVTANGGEGGRGQAQGVAGLSGCGNGGNLSPGESNTTISEFEDGITFYSGGGGAGKHSTYETYGYAGGTPNGAEGACASYTYPHNINAKKASIGGGGGGNAVYVSDNQGTTYRGNASSGGSGLVAIRIHLS